MKKKKKQLKIKKLCTIWSLQRKREFRPKLANEEGLSMSVKRKGALILVMWDNHVGFYHGREECFHSSEQNVLRFWWVFIILWGNTDPTAQSGTNRARATCKDHSVSLQEMGNWSSPERRSGMLQYTTQSVKSPRRCHTVEARRRIRLLP